MESPPQATRFLPADELDHLIRALRDDGYTVVGPTIDQGAIVYREISSAAELPRGYGDEQEAGRYRLVPRGDDSYFGYVIGPHSWKGFLFPPTAHVATAEKTDAGWEFSSPDLPVPRYAFLGVRSCELAAIAVQDRVFLGEGYIDPTYKARREAALFVAVNCTQAASTCFCTSMNSGPRCATGFDLALTEIDGGFTLEIGSNAGQIIVEKLSTGTTDEATLQQAAARRQRAVEQITRRLDTEGIHDLLLDNLDHPRWGEVATRCLSCANCTMVCPTCFCASVREVPSLDGNAVQRERVWDSCFNIDFSYTSGGVMRNSIGARYRQWLTHKLASWIDQFGTSGCVGCGRCITWCPVAIDLTEEVAAIRATH